jgi:hypothetical protein
MKLNRANNINYRGGGKKGKAGRKSIREEKKAVDFLKEVFFEGFDMEKGLASEKAIVDGRGYVKFADLLAHRATKDSRLLARMFEMLVGSQEGALMKENNTTVFYQVYLPSPDGFPAIESQNQVTVIDE